MNGLRQLQERMGPRKGRSHLLVPVFVAWGLALLVVFGYFWTDQSASASLGRYYLVPWALVTGAVLLAPSIYLWRKGTFDPFHPLVYAVWTYLFPAFVVGAFILTFALTDPYFLNYIDIPTYTLPLSLVYVSIGFIGMTAGYVLPVGGYLSAQIEKLICWKDWGADDLWLPGFFLILVGIALNIVGFVQGLIGYQIVVEIGEFDSLVVFLASIFTVGYILLWLAVFQSKRRTLAFYAAVALLVVLIPLRMTFQGNRSSLMLSVIPIGLAYLYSGRRPKKIHAFIFGALLVAAVAVGIAYGTAFRNIKGSEARMEAGDYFGQVAATFEYLSSTDPGIVLDQAGRELAQRMENLSSLAVVVSNYEKLEPYEESYGIRNNVYNELLTSFIPRFIWPDKPIVSDARAYSDLYFNEGDNSFAITVFGDLLRNFGAVGIPIGMMLLGIYLRVVYSVLIATPEPRIWKKTAYYPLLLIVNYEGFYSSIFPNTIRVLAVVSVSLVVAGFFARRVAGNNGPPS